MNTPFRAAAACLLALLSTSPLTARSQLALKITLDSQAKLRVAKVKFLLQQHAAYREPELIDSDHIELKVKRSYGLHTAFDFDASGKPEPVDVIRYEPADPAYADLLAGPTLVFHRNRPVKLELRNELVAAEVPLLSDKVGCAPGSPLDVWKEDAASELFNTNLHTHGLHVSPEGDHDNVFVDLGPGKSKTYDYRLEAGHTAGTFWYHAHRHMAVAYQLVNGMAGTLIVPGEPKADPSAEPSAQDDLEAIPQIVEANKIPDAHGAFGRVMLIQQFRFAETTRPAGGGQHFWVVDPADISDRKEALDSKNVHTIAEGILPVGNPGPTTRFEDILSTNGVRAPVITMGRGCVERWRFIHAGIESPVDAQWFKWTGSDLVPIGGDDSLAMYEIALDGIPTGYMDQVATLTLRPGYRSDMLVHIADSAKTGDVYVLMTQEVQAFNAKRLAAVTVAARRKRLSPFAAGLPLEALPLPGEIPSNAIAIVCIGEGSRHMEMPAASDFARWRISQPMSVQKTQEVGFHFVDADPNAPDTEPHGKGGEFGVTANHVQKPYAQTINREAIELRLDQPEEWILQVDNAQHPFHIHVNPFQVQDARYLDGNGQGRWVWRDTFLLDAANGPTHIRLLPKDFIGRSVLHCHILDHEDQGMMENIDIDGPHGEKSAGMYFLRPVSPGQGIELPLALAGSPGKRRILIVYTGVACPHCAAALRAVASRSADLGDVEVLAVSAMPVPNDAATLLGIPPGSSVRLHPEVPDKAVFSKLGVLTADGSVEHAVILFDEQKHETYRYVGEGPLPDLDEIPTALARMPIAQPADSGVAKGF